MMWTMNKASPILKAGITKVSHLSESEWLAKIAIRPASIMTQNTKMKKDGIWNITFPAQQVLINNHGVVNTCQGAKACKQYCYASNGFYSSTVAMVKHARNFDYIMNDPFGFANQLIQEINARKATIIRIHDSGDFTKETWLVFKEVMLSLPHVKFYAYTKRVSFFLKMKNIPSNFTYVFSFGGKEDHLIDRSIHRHSQIFTSLDDLTNAGYTDTHISDLPAADPSILKIGLFVHGIYTLVPRFKTIIDSLPYQAPIMEHSHV